MPEFINKLTTAMKNGAINGDQYEEMLRNVHNGFISIPDGISQVNQALDEHRQKVALANDANQAQIVSLFNATTSWSEFKQEAEAAGLDLGWITEEIYNAQKAADALAEANQNAASATESVRDATNDANAAMQRYTSSLLFKIASEGLSSEGAYRLAEAMGLVDKNTVAATKQTNVYKQMLDSGMISQRQYNALIADLDDKISNLPEGKELTVTANTEEVMTRLRAIEAFQFGDKPARVKYEVDDSAVRGYRPPTLFGTVNYNANVAVVASLVEAWIETDRARC